MSQIVTKSRLPLPLPSRDVCTYAMRTPLSSRSSPTSYRSIKGVGRATGSSPKVVSRDYRKRSLTMANSSVASQACLQSHSLLIIGPGVLGSLVGMLWKSQFKDAEVVGQTNTTANHDRLQAMGVTPRVKKDAPDRKFASVIFSAPPSGSSDYVAEVKNAISFWDGTGTFIFTSSMGVYDPPENQPITEDTPLHPKGTSERLDRLLCSEEAVLQAGGSVVRFVGLYHAHRGAHTFFLRQGQVQRWGGHIVNLIHYEDAARLCVEILRGGEEGPFRGKVFLGTDCNPISFQDMMDATLASGAFEGSVEFTGPSEQNSGPGSSNKATRDILHWTPKYRSFKEFMQAGAKDIYTELPF